MSDDEVAVVRQHRREVRCERVLLILNAVELLIDEVKITVHEIDERRGVGRTVHGSTALQRHIANEHVFRFALNHNEHAAFYFLMLGIGHVRPSILVHILLYGGLERREHLFVRALYRVRVNGHGAVDLLRRKGSTEYSAQSTDR